MLSAWTLRTSLALAAVPALIYMVQNLAIAEACRHMPPLVFNVVNQTKVWALQYCEGYYVINHQYYITRPRYGFTRTVLGYGQSKGLTKHGLIGRDEFLTLPPTDSSIDGNTCLQNLTLTDKYFPYIQWAAVSFKFTRYVTRDTIHVGIWSRMHLV